MKRKIILMMFACIAFVIVLSLISVPASATPTDVYTIDWYTIDGGGAMNITGGTYSLSGTIGQPDAGTVSGGTYILTGGFWGLADQLLSNGKLYLPFIQR